MNNSINQEDRKAKVLTFASGKGGVGKSTLVRGLSAHWLSRGWQVGVVDADPEARIERRHDPDGPMAKLTIAADADASGVARQIEKLSTDNEIVLVDTAGFRNQTQVMACVSADLVVIPLRPAPDDVDDAVAMFDLITELNATPERSGIPIKAALVMTMVRRGTVIARRLAKDIRAAGLPLLQAQIRDRIAFPEAAISGLGPAMSEPSGEAAFEIAKLGNELEQLGGLSYVKRA